MRQIDLVLQKRSLSRLNCALCANIRDWLLKQVSDELAQLINTPNDLCMFSLFSRVQQSNIALRLSFLHEDAVPLWEAARSAQIIDIADFDGGIAVLDRVDKLVVSLEQLCKPAPKCFRIILASPATNPNRGEPPNFYALPALLSTAAHKLMKYESVKISSDELNEICSLVSYSRYDLRTEEYTIDQGKPCQGFVGNLLLRPGGTSAQRDKLAFLLRYAAYAGIGAKTDLGMGGILLME